MEITIKIKNEEKAKTILSILNELPFVEIKKSKKANSSRDFENLFGIWKDRDILATTLRKKAWRGNASIYF
ncbi:MAG: hypothetical protein GWP06_04085 [Actinobacteria bacterium]|nr:hypothetical protein [Actinomycetota bacterium]